MNFKKFLRVLEYCFVIFAAMLVVHTTMYFVFS